MPGQTAGGATAWCHVAPTAFLHTFDLQSASFVDDRGQILVSGLQNGSQRYALLTPVPEPSTMALALGGLAVLTWRARKAAAVRSQA